MHRFIALVICVVTVSLSIGCGGGRATLFVDNNSKDSMHVEIAGERTLYVGPGDHAKRHLTYGEHRVVVKQKGKVIFDETKSFEPHEGGPGWRHYLLDPKGRTRYAVYDFYYYKDPEKAKTEKSSKRVKRLSKNKWIDIPAGATVMEPMPIVVTSSEEDRTSAQCVCRDR